MRRTFPGGCFTQQGHVSGVFGSIPCLSLSLMIHLLNQTPIHLVRLFEPQLIPINCVFNRLTCFFFWF